jgi:gamma-glutamyltranspeptidase/glutathione hydrolase
MTEGMITAPQPEAVDAGVEVLEDGGNVVDAAVATALVQTAVDPQMCGIAGFGSMQLWLPEHDAHLCLDFHGRAPLAATPDMWADHVLGETEDGFGFIVEGGVNEIGYQSITTPIALRAYADALDRFGTRCLADLIQPAIAYAEEGFLVRPHMSAYWHDPEAAGRVPNIERLLRDPATRKIYAKPDGSLPRVGERLRNPDMARTYRRIAAAGVGDFYRGEIAQEILSDMRANGGLLDVHDLNGAATRVNPPLEGRYRGYRVTTNPPPGGGIILLEMLNILEHFDLAAMGHNSPEYLATLTEAMKLATIDKDAKVGDPEFVDVPVEKLTSKSYAASLAERIAAGEMASVPRLGGGRESPHTTHISAVDAAGNGVALTHSLGMPSGVVTEGLGFMYNGCMGVFDPRPGRPGSLAPGKARFTAMAPTMLFRDSSPILILGAPGGTYITMGVIQAILNIVEFGMTAQEAVSAPRISATSNTVEISNRIRRKTEHALVARGYSVRRSALSYDFASVHALRRADGVWDGGADPSRDGMALCPDTSSTDAHQI